MKFSALAIATAAALTMSGSTTTAAQQQVRGLRSGGTDPMVGLPVDPRPPKGDGAGPKGGPKDGPKGGPKDGPKGGPKDGPKGGPKDGPKGGPKEGPKGGPKDGPKGPKGGPKDGPKGAGPKEGPKGGPKVGPKGGPKAGGMAGPKGGMVGKGKGKGLASKGVGGGDGLAGKYFGTYDFYPGTGKDVFPSAFYFTIDAITDDIYHFKQCFSVDGGESFLNTGQGSLVGTSHDTFHVNIFQEDFELGDVEDGYAFSGFQKGSDMAISLTSFFDATAFTAYPHATDVELDDYACPM